MLRDLGDQDFNDDFVDDVGFYWDDKGDQYGNRPWIRVGEMHDENGRDINNLVLTDEFEANDIAQGSLGDCWFLSAMSAVAHVRPDLMTSLVHPST